MKSFNEYLEEGFVNNIEDLSLRNNNFRKVLYTAKHCQLVVMSLKPNQDIGSEVHHLDQFIRIERGTGESILNGAKTDISAGYAILIPAGTRHDIINTGTSDMKLYTIYSPPNHRDGVIHKTKFDAENSKEHFDGKTSE